MGPPIQRQLGELMEGGDDDSSDSDDRGSEDDDEHGSHHDHHHHHRQQHHEGFNPEDIRHVADRLMDIDNACVCQIFARLPKFVTKPKHVMSLSPVEGCEVTFECDGS